MCGIVGYIGSKEPKDVLLEGLKKQKTSIALTLEKVKDFQQQFLQKLRSAYKETVLDVLSKGKLTEEVESLIKTEAKRISEQYIHK